MFSQSKFTLISNLFLVTEIIMFILIALPINPNIQFAALSFGFLCVIAFIIYVAIYFIKRNKAS